MNRWDRNVARHIKVKVAHTRLPSVGFRSWSRFLAAGDVSHKPGGRLPLLSARPAVTLATLKTAATSFAAWWTDARWVWTVWLRLSRLQFEPGPFCVWVQHANHSATEPPTYVWRVLKPGAIDDAVWSRWRHLVSGVGWWYNTVLRVLGSLHPTVGSTAGCHHVDFCTLLLFELFYMVKHMYVCMYAIFIWCDRRTSNNKHKKQSQNDVQYKAAKPKNYFTWQSCINNG